MDRDVQDMLDSFKIRQVLERYCRGVDRRDEALINSVYWPEATDDHGIWKGPGQEFGAFIIPVIAHTYTATMHNILQSNIVVSGDRAAGDTYCLAVHRIEKADGLASDFAYCRYADVFEKRGSEWRILERTVLMEHVQGFADADPGNVDVNAFTRGIPGREDLTYKLFAQLEALPV